MPRLLSVMKQFPFSQALPGVGYMAVHPISFNEPTIFEEAFDFRTGAEEAVARGAEFLHEDYGYEFEAMWDIWVPQKEGDLDETWVMLPQRVTFYAFGKQFEEGAYQEDGHIQVSFGLDVPFLNEDGDLTPAVIARIKANVQKLVSFIHDVEKNCGISGRILWSESETNLAQKLVAKLQKIQ